MAVKSKGRGYIAQERGKPEETKHREEKNNKGRPGRDDSWTKRTINVNDTIWAKLKVYAFFNKTTVGKILEIAAEQYLQKVESEIARLMKDLPSYSEKIPPRK